MLDPEMASAIARLSQQGHSQRKIAAELHVGRSTVRRYLSDSSRGLRTENLLRPKDFKLDVGNQDKILSLVQQAKGNCSIVSRRLNDNPEAYGLPKGFSVSQRSVRRFALKRFPGEFARSCPPVTYPFHCEPGQQLQIDFVKAKYLFTDDKNLSEEQTVYLFEAVYAWSRKSFIRVCADMTQASWLSSIAMCLAANGVPRQILCDNDKGLVLENRWRDGYVHFNPAFEWLCKPLGVMPRAARPARPQTKGRCERYGGYLQKNGLIDVSIERNLRDRADLQAALDQWIRDVADKRVIEIGGQKGTIADFYEQEKRYLLFPAALSAGLDVMSWTTRASPNAGVYIYGTRTQLPIKMAGLYVTVTLRANGEFAISASGGKVIREGSIASENMNRFKRDEGPTTGTEKLVSNSDDTIAAEFKDLADIFGESYG